MCARVTRLLLDMDPGVDDALAILLAARTPGVEIVGITTSCGNVGATQSALNALPVLDAAGVSVDFPVRVGLDGPLSGWPEGQKPNAEEVHGPGGLGKTRWPEPDEGRVSKTSAVDLILSTYAVEGGDVTLVVTGPMTNVAQALRQDPGLSARIPRLVVMGGAFTVPGNMAPYGEFNVWADPVAAREVLRCGAATTIVGLDVTTRCVLTAEDVAARLSPDTWPLGGFVSEITAHYMRFHQRTEGFYGCFLHDPLTVACAICPDIVRTEPYAIDVVTDLESPAYGMTVIDRRRRQQMEGPPVGVAVDVAPWQLRERLLTALAPPVTPIS